MFQGWGFGPLTSADAFSQDYSNFTRDQNHLEAGMDLFRTPVKVIWGEVDFYISSEMGVEFATRAQAEITVFPGLGHYPHLQNPQVIVEEVRASFDGLGA